MGDLIIRADDGTKYHRTINVCNVFDHPQRPGEAEANAKLIASAPELLEALIEVSAGMTPDRFKESTFHKVISAIQKATT